MQKPSWVLRRNKHWLTGKENSSQMLQEFFKILTPTPKLAENVSLINAAVVCNEIIKNKLYMN